MNRPLQYVNNIQRMSNKRWELKETQRLLRLKIATAEFRCSLFVINVNNMIYGVVMNFETRDQKKEMFADKFKYWGSNNLTTKQAEEILRALYTLKLSDFTVWRHNWPKNWVNCAVLTGNSVSLRTVLSSRLSRR